MAARCYMCLLRSLINRKRSISSVISYASLSSQFSIPEKSRNLSYVLCRKFSRSYVSKNSQDSSNILGQLNLSAGAVKNNSSSNKSENDDQTSEKKKKEESSKRAMKYTFIAFGTLFTGVVGSLLYEWGSPHLDEEGNVIKDEFSEMPTLKAYILRTYKEMMYYNKLIREPSREKLLPDPLTEPYYQPPYTLVLEMTGILVHPDWTYQTGWRFKKRPGVDYFLQQIGPPLFEVVIYTSEQGFTAYPILDTLDPNGFIMYRLFRDATRYVEGHHVKDLSCLNRDLSKVIFLDWDQRSFAMQPENALMIKKWKGNDDDRMLYELASLLRTIATSEVEDVRQVLEYYSQFDDPISVYKEKQQKLQEEEQKRIQESLGQKSTIAGSMASSLRGRR